MNCKEYQDDVKRRSENDEAAKKTQKFLEVIFITYLSWLFFRNMNELESTSTFALWMIRKDRVFNKLEGKDLASLFVQSVDGVQTIALRT